MAAIEVIEKVDQLRKYLNDKNVVEIVVRNKDKTFKAFQKVALNNLPKNEVQEQIQKVINILNKNTKINENTLKLLNSVSKIGSLNMILNGLNLCATCAGFAIVFMKLDKMSGQMKELLSKVKQGTEVQADYEYKKIISEHSDMLDCRKKQKYYTEEQMRKLVDGEYNVLNLLIEVFRKDLSTDKESLIFSIYSLASMLAVSIRFFDEVYFFNNKEAIGEGDVWHSSHDNWVAVFDQLASEDFVERIQDHGIFELNLNTTEADQYYISLYDQAKSLKQDITDNQKLIEAIGDKELFELLREQTMQDVRASIEEAFKEADVSLEDEEIAEVYDNAMRLVVAA